MRAFDSDFESVVRLPIVRVEYASTDPNFVVTYEYCFKKHVHLDHYYVRFFCFFFLVD